MNINWSSSFVKDSEDNVREEKGILNYSYHGCFGFAICKLHITQTGFFNLEFGGIQKSDYRIQTTGTHTVNNYNSLELIASVPEGSLLNGYEKNMDKYIGGTYKNKNLFGKIAEYWNKGDTLWCLSQDINKEKKLPKLKLHKFNEDDVIKLKKGNKIFILKGSVDIEDDIFTHETRRQISVVSESKEMICLSDGYMVYVTIPE